jgi:hypothetical protein
MVISSTSTSQDFVEASAYVQSRSGVFPNSLNWEDEFLRMGSFRREGGRDLPLRLQDIVEPPRHS